MYELPNIMFNVEGGRFREPQPRRHRTGRGRRGCRANHLRVRHHVARDEERDDATHEVHIQVQSCPATTRLVITLIGCNAVGRASRFFRPLVFFLILYIFLDCKLLYLLCTLPRCTFTTMSIVYLFVSVLLLYVGK